MGMPPQICSRKLSKLPSSMHHGCLGTKGAVCDQEAPLAPSVEVETDRNDPKLRERKQEGAEVWRQASSPWTESPTHWSPGSAIEIRVVHW